MTNLAPETNKPTRNKWGNIKVLLAEDNEVNQLLAKSILQYWGLESKTATTGSQVIELLNQEDFDVVLMDIQMPEKSGIEATHEIRQMADSRKRNIPIIALTANALKGEEKKYIAAGMDDFLTKPFKEHELYEVMSRVFNHEGSFGREFDSNAVPEAVEAVEDKLYDLKNVRDVARGSEDFVLTLVKIFIDTIPADSKEMVKACNEKKWDTLSKFAHKIKSTIDMLNIKSIKEIIRVIELDAKQGVNTAALPALVTKVDQTIEKVSLALQKEFDIK
jgi:CheY-like chemotaxis protein